MESEKSPSKNSNNCKQQKSSDRVRSRMRPKRNSNLNKVDSGSFGCDSPGNKQTIIKPDQKKPTSSLLCSHPSKQTDSVTGYTCSGCNKSIKRDKFLFKACDKYWHETCLKCDHCQAKLGELGNSFYCKSNLHLCRQDYFELFGNPGICSVCDKSIRAYEMVMRAKNNVYHLECFGCQLCNLRFCVGERFYLCENKIVCQYDYDDRMLQLTDAPPQSDSADALSKSSHQFPTVIDFINQTGNISSIRQLCDMDQPIQ